MCDPDEGVTFDGAYSRNAGRMKKRAPWGHVSRHCRYCGKVGPRTIVAGGWAHKRCIPKRKKLKAKR